MSPLPKLWITKIIIFAKYNHHLKNFDNLNHLRVMQKRKSGRGQIIFFQILLIALYTVCVWFQAGVSGHHCEECVSGWFGLSTDNPDGCSQCFCSGVSRNCEEQGGLTRVPVSIYNTVYCISIVHAVRSGGKSKSKYIHLPNTLVPNLFLSIDHPSSLTHSLAIGESV